jgi:hypothetical protein
MSTTQNILCMGYFWPFLFHDFMLVVMLCEHCQIFFSMIEAPTTPLYLIIIANCLCKWGIHFMECHNTSNDDHYYIIVVVGHFTKFDEAMQTFNFISHTVVGFFFNYVITHFGVPKQLVFDKYLTMVNIWLPSNGFHVGIHPRLFQSLLSSS